MPENVHAEDFYKHAAVNNNNQFLSNTWRPMSSSLEDIFGGVSITENAVSNPQGSRSTGHQHSRASLAEGQSSLSTFFQENHDPFSSKPSLENHDPFSSKSSLENHDPFSSKSSPENQLPFRSFVNSENSTSPGGLLGNPAPRVLERSASYPQQPLASPENQSLSYDRSKTIHSESATAQRNMASINSTPQPILAPAPIIPWKPVPLKEVLEFGPHMTYEWDISITRVQEWAKLYEWWSGDLGVLIGAKAVELFKNSGLSTDILGQIWDLADTEDRGLLKPSDFQIAMHLISACKAGRQNIALKPDAVASLREKLNRTLAVSRPLGASDFKSEAVESSNRAQYEEECFEMLLPWPKEIFVQVKPGRSTSVVPLDYDPFADDADHLDSFDDGDLSDDEDIFSHRIAYYRDRVISFYRDGMYSEALAELVLCKYPPGFDFRISIAKAILYNMDRNNEGNGAVAAAALAKASYSQQDSVLTNLLLYFTRALSRYHFGNGDANYQLALEDCKRGLKLAKVARIQSHDGLAGFVKSDIAELAVAIALRTNARADVQFYQALVGENHDTHSLISLEPGAIVLSSREHQQGLDFLHRHNIIVDDMFVIRGTPKDIFRAFDSALAEKNFAACYLIAASTAEGTNDPKMIRNDGLVEQTRDIYQLLCPGIPCYPPTLLHFIASHPEITFGCRIAEELIRLGMPVDAIADIHNTDDSTSSLFYGYSLKCYTPLGYAVIFKNILLMEVLISHGAKMELMDLTIGPGWNLKSYYMPEVNFIPSPIFLATYFAGAIGSLDPLHCLLDGDANVIGISPTTWKQSRPLPVFGLFATLAICHLYNSSQLRGDENVTKRNIDAMKTLAERAKWQVKAQNKLYDPFNQAAWQNTLNLWQLAARYDHPTMSAIVRTGFERIIAVLKRLPDRFILETS